MFKHTQENSKALKHWPNQNNHHTARYAVDQSLVWPIVSTQSMRRVSHYDWKCWKSGMKWTVATTLFAPRVSPSIAFASYRRCWSVQPNKCFSLLLICLMSLLLSFAAGFVHSIPAKMVRRFHMFNSRATCVVRRENWTNWSERDPKPTDSTRM